MVSSFSIFWLRKSIMGNLKDTEKHKKKEWNKLMFFKICHTNNTCITLIFYIIINQKYFFSCENVILHRIYFLLFLDLLIYWLCWVFAAHGFSPVVASGGYSLIVTYGLIAVVSCQAWALVFAGFSNCSTWSWLLLSMWNLSWPGLNPCACLGRWIPLTTLGVLIFFLKRCQVILTFSTIYYKSY